MPTDIDLPTLIDAISKITVVSGLILILIQGAKERPGWVFGREYRRLQRSEEIWRGLALKGQKVTEDAIQKAGQALDIAEAKKDA